MIVVASTTVINNCAANNPTTAANAKQLPGPSPSLGGRGQHEDPDCRAPDVTYHVTSAVTYYVTCQLLRDYVTIT